MADAPIKTQVLNAIVARIETVALINTVERHHSEVDFRNRKMLPAAFVFDGNEDNPEQRNRLRIATFPLDVYVWFHNTGTEKSKSDQSDLMHADVYEVLVADRGNTLESLGAEITDEDMSPAVEKFYSSEDMAGIILHFEVKYKTNKDSLYTNKYDSGANLHP